MRRNDDADIRELALKKPPSADWPYPLILDQIKARQKAAVKIPSWSEHPDIVFPSSDLIEQASSTATAQYKAVLASGRSFADLTGGAGVDCAALASRFERGICIDCEENAAALLSHNLARLTQTPIEVYCESAENFLGRIEPVDLIMIDPQRRTQTRKGFFRLEDCSPDVPALLELLKTKTKRALIKTSPMLDIAQAIIDLGCVRAVHILEWRGDCKEVVYDLDFESPPASEDIPRICVSLDDEGAVLKRFEFSPSQEQARAETTLPQAFLYEPGPAFQKAGGFNAIAHRYSVQKLHEHTHLYTSEIYNPDFPGRAFEIIEILPVQHKALPLKKANLSIRNFPGDVASLRKKLKLQEGGDSYLFACTLADERKVLVHGRKAG
ncbi:MAG: class I SAM-dependent methyltransferase [Alphaproteobacteria bacterium]|nr:class I SAM-dependent methyltransferase [Alphaproteobacteria bacterium]